MEVQFAVWINFLILLAAMIIRYFVLSGFFYWICQKTKRSPVSQRARVPGQNRRDVKWSLLSSVVFAAAGTVMISLWASGKTLIYTEIKEYGVAYLLLSLPLYLFLHDTYYYWMHRLLHRGELFSRIHWVHHSSVVPTAWTSFAFHPLEAIMQAVLLPAMVLLIPIHWVLLIVFLMAMTLMGILNHLGHDFFSNLFERHLKFITATHHQLHHEWPARNFGLYFTWWDRLMGTEGERNG